MDDPTILDGRNLLAYTAFHTDSRLDSKARCNVASDARDILQREAEDLPAPLLEEVLDFVRFLKMKAAHERMETAVLSESALGKDWLRIEEDEAWRDL